MMLLAVVSGNPIIEVNDSKMLNDKMLYNFTTLKTAVSLQAMQTPAGCAYNPTNSTSCSFLLLATLYQINFTF